MCGCIALDEQVCGCVLQALKAARGKQQGLKKKKKKGDDEEASSGEEVSDSDEAVGAATLPAPASIQKCFLHCAWASNLGLDLLLAHKPSSTALGRAGFRADALPRQL